MWPILRKILEVEAFVSPGAAALWCKSCFWEELSPWVGKPMPWVTWLSPAVFWLKHLHLSLSVRCVLSGASGRDSAVNSDNASAGVLVQRYSSGIQQYPLAYLFPSCFSSFFPPNNLCYIWKWCFSLLTASEYEKAGEGVAGWQGSFLIWEVWLRDPLFHRDPWWLHSDKWENGDCRLVYVWESTCSW